MQLRNPCSALQVLRKCIPIGPSFMKNELSQSILSWFGPLATYKAHCPPSQASASLFGNPPQCILSEYLGNLMKPSSPSLSSLMISTGSKIMGRPVCCEDFCSTVIECKLEFNTEEGLMANRAAKQVFYPNNPTGRLANDSGPLSAWETSCQ